MSAQAEFIHIICTDPRIQKIYHEYLGENNLFGKFDTIEYENPILDFLDDHKRSAIVARIKLYIQLHGAKKIVLFDHLDCGAYAQSGYVFAGKQEEIRAHRKNAHKARQLIREYWPELEVVIKYIAVNGRDNCQWLRLD